MNLRRLVIRNLWARKLSALLTLTLLSLGVGVVTMLLLVGHQTQERMDRDGRNIDLVVGAKGSPLQLILSSVYHLDIPTGNIPLAGAQKLMGLPMVKTAIPLALGDNHAGFRIVGSPVSYAAFYGAELAQGRLHQKSMEAVLGAEAARRTGLKKGDTFVGSHGLEGVGDHHAHNPYRVVGVLKPNGSVLDRLILTPIESVWQVHQPEREHPGDEEHEGEHEEDRPPASAEVTALLLQFRAPVFAITMHSVINRQSNLQAARPAMEMARLFALLGTGLDVLSALGGLLVIMAALSVFVALYNALSDRKYDLAIMRTLGAARSKVFLALLLEGVVLSLTGGVLGLLLGHGATAAVAVRLQQAGQLAISGGVWLPQEAALLGLVALLGVCASLLPAWLATRIEVAGALSEGR